MSSTSQQRRRWVFKRISLRWFLLGIFFVPLLDSASPLPETDGAFIWLTFASLLACALLLTRLARPWRQTLWVWLVLFVFLVGYYWKTYWFGRDFGQLMFFLSEWQQIGLTDVAEGYRWITLAFGVFCLTTWFVLGGKRGSRSQHPQPEGRGRVSTKRMLGVLLIMAILSLALSGLRAALGLKIMGTEVLGGRPTMELPLHLSTVIQRLQNDAIPAVLLLGVWVMERESRRWWILAMSLLFMHYVVLSVVMASRGGLVLVALHALFLWLITKRLTRRRMHFIALLVIVTIVVFFPLMTIFREVRVMTTKGLSGSLKLAFDLFWGFDWRRNLSWLAQKLVFRVSGADSVWYSLDDIGGFPIQRVMHIRTESIARYFTQTAVKVVNPRELRAPGLVASSMLLGGVPGVMGMWVGFVLFADFLWKWLSRFQTAPVVLTIGAYYVFAFAMGGMLSYRDFVSLLITVLMCEWLYRNVLVLRRARRGSRLSRNRTVARGGERLPIGGADVSVGPLA